MDIIFYWCFLTLFFTCSKNYMAFKGNDILLVLGVYIGLIGTWCSLLVVTHFSTSILASLTYVVLAILQYKWIECR